jgi:hypothetical protein
MAAEQQLLPQYYGMPAAWGGMYPTPAATPTAAMLQQQQGMPGHSPGPNSGNNGGGAGGQSSSSVAGGGGQGASMQNAMRRSLSPSQSPMAEHHQQQHQVTKSVTLTAGRKLSDVHWTETRSSVRVESEIVDFPNPSSTILTPFSVWRRCHLRPRDTQY